MLEGGVGLLADGVARDVDLDAPACVLQRGEAGLAHHALEHHAAGDAGHARFRLELFGRLAAVGRVQVGGVLVGLEVVGKGDALAFALRLAQGLEFFAALGDQLVVVLGRGRGGAGGMGHGAGQLRGKPAILVSP